MSSNWRARSIEVTVPFDGFARAQDAADFHLGIAQVLLRRMRRGSTKVGQTTRTGKTSKLAHVDRLELLNSQTGRWVDWWTSYSTFSKIESGKLEFDWAPVDLRQLARDVVARLQLSTAQHTIKVDFDGTSDGTVTADRDHLEQVLDNLVSNAIKFFAGGRNDRRFVAFERQQRRAQRRRRGRRHPGPSTRSRIRLFYQAADPVSRRTGGMGLGLYISKEIINRHNGRIWPKAPPARAASSASPCLASASKHGSPAKRAHGANPQQREAVPDGFPDGVFLSERDLRTQSKRSSSPKKAHSIRVALRKKKICLLEKTSSTLKGKSILEKKTIFVKKRPFFLYERLHF